MSAYSVGMASDVVPCPSCGAKNRVPAASSGKPTCAKCRVDLPWLVDATEAAFAQVTDTSRLVLVDLWAPWCGPCRTVAPILETLSGLVFNRDFFAGYSPERINPGDTKHRLPDILKITSGSTPAAAELVNDIYARVITAGTHRASSIRVAEAAKVIENIQRDVNIALINELAMIFNKLGLDTEEVLEAAGSKWNFLPFRPGLVGGHCIGVDPYYLTHKAQEIGYHPEMILAGRRINDNMGGYVAGQVVRLMSSKRIHVDGSRILVLGLTFKENCPDLRNSHVVDVVRELEAQGAKVDVCDPWANRAEARHEYGIAPIRTPKRGQYDAIVAAVAHREFKAMTTADVRKLGRRNHVLYDIKYVFPKDEVDGRL